MPHNNFYVNPGTEEYSVLMADIDFAINEYDNELAALVEYNACVKAAAEEAADQAWVEGYLKRLGFKAVSGEMVL